jgi:acyl dehydratase
MFGDVPAEVRMTWFEDIPLNVRVTLGSYTFTEENIIAFARRYDPQPFHVDKDAALRSPYGGLIASGWHTAAVWMKLMLAYRRARIVAGAEETQENYVSPGVREIRWLKPVRPGTMLIYTNEPFAKLAWKSRPQFGLMEGRNEARDAAGELYYSFINRVLIARRPK